MKRAFLLLAVGAGCLLSQPAAPEHPGPLPDGSTLLASGWRVKPVGVQIPVDTLPMSAVISPDEKYLLVLNAGRHAPSVSVIDLATGKETNRSEVPDGWLGLAITKAGDRVYVGGGSRAAIYEFKFANGMLTPSRQFPIVADKDRKPEDFIGDVKLSPDDHLLYAAELYHDSIVVVNPQSGVVLSRIKTAKRAGAVWTGRRPYRILFHPSGKSIFVSSWEDGTVGQFDVSNGSQLANVRVGPHPTDMVWRAGRVENQPSIAARIFVSASNSNNVFVLGVTDAGSLSRGETIDIALTPHQPLGSTPSGLGLSADGARLFVACSDVNVTAVVDITGERSHVIGFVPTGAYPTAAVGLPDGRVAVLSGKSNLVQIADAADDKIPAYSRDARALSRYSDDVLDEEAGKMPIHHVIYIVKSGRTYDEVLGDVKSGNGDASLAQFGEKVTPNQHKLARDFALLDNFYASSDGAAEGLGRALAAITPQYTALLAPNSEAGRRNAADYEGQEGVNEPPAGYLWTNAAQAGISMGNYGFFVGDPSQKPRDPVLAPITDPDFRGPDPSYPDVNRAKDFIDDLHSFERTGMMPQLLFLRLAGDRTPQGVTDNDEAVGMIAEAVAKSRFWNDTVMFIVESDAGNGASDTKRDHVDAHRTTCYVVSPFVKRGVVDHAMYTEASVLRAIELILGLHPMTTFDAAARPLFGVFTATPNPAAWTAAGAQ